MDIFLFIWGVALSQGALKRPDGDPLGDWAWTMFYAMMDAVMRDVAPDAVVPAR